MIDTVTLDFETKRLNLPANKFQTPLTNYGHIWHLYNQTDNRPSYLYREYLPKVVYVHYERTDYVGLRVTVSIPKLIFGNNLFEVRRKDFDTVCRTLQTKLKAMGITVTQKQIKESRVREVQYSKNIVCYGLPFILFWQQINTSKIPDRIGDDVYKVVYKSGKQITYAGRAKEFTIYDKYTELNAHRQPINVDNFWERADTKNILRFEVRYKTADAVKELFAMDSLPTFIEVYKAGKAKQSILQYWKALEESAYQYEGAQFCSNSHLLYLLAQQNPKARPQTILATCALARLIDENGYQEAKALLNQTFNLRKRQQLLRISELMKLPAVPPQYNTVWIVDSQLRKWYWLTKETLNKPQPKVFDAETASLWEQLITVEEGAKILKIKPKTLRKWCRERKISCYRFGDEYRLKQTDIRDVLYRLNRTRKRLVLQ